jgi:hypothetical protein
MDATSSKKSLIGVVPTQRPRGAAASSRSAGEAIPLLAMPPLEDMARGPRVGIVIPMTAGEILME